MTNEDRQRTIEFILQQQAQVSASIQRHEEYIKQLEEERLRDRPRQAELQESFQVVVELLKIQESRLDRSEVRLDTSEARLDTSEARLDTSEARLDTSEARLHRVEFDTVAIEARTATIETNMATLQTSMAALAVSQAHADERLSTLIEIVSRDRRPS
jgi:chromosome segregation ATPase